MSAIRILHVSSPHTWRGGEQQIAYLVQELDGKGAEQWVMTPGGSALAAFGKRNNWNVVPYKKMGGVDLGLATRMARFAKKNRIQLIHCHDAHAHAGAVLSASLFRNTVPVVISRRVDFPVGRSRFSLWKYNHRCIRAIICVSDTIRGIVAQDITNPDILIRTVHSGIDLGNAARAENGKLRAELGIAGNVKLIGNVAALAEHKDHFTFIDTALHFRDREDLLFVVFGDGPLRDKVLEYARSKNAGNVVFKGFRDNLDEIWPDLDVFLFTSRTEGLGTSILDAMLNKVPVVTTNAGGIPEIIAHNASGYLADVGDSEDLAQGVRTMLSDQEYRDRIITNASSVVNEFSKGKTAEKTFDIYQEVLQQKM